MEIVSFVILHYGDSAVTDRCVQSILRMEQQECIRIVLVDNEIDAPPQLRIAFAQKYQTYENIAVLQIKENGGFSYANNQGYMYARKRQNADFILLLNNDIEFTQKNFLKKLEAAYEQQQCHVLGPDIIRRSTGEHQNPMDTRLRTVEEAEYTVRMNRRALRLYPLLYPLLYLNIRRAERRQTDERKRRSACFGTVYENIVPFGACLIFTPEFVRREERAFEPETRFYYEEYILALRCRKKGYKIVYTPALQVLHESGTATAESQRSGYNRLRFMMERTVEAAEVYLRNIKKDIIKYER